MNIMNQMKNYPVCGARDRKNKVFFFGVYRKVFFMFINLHDVHKLGWRGGRGGFWWSNLSFDGLNLKIL